MEFNTQKSIFENMKQFLKSVSDKLSDFNTGSVLNSLFYAISHSIGNLNESLRNVYNSIFIATAVGENLDKKVADFSLERKIATISTGTVTFYRSEATPNDIFIPEGTRIKTISTQDIPGIEFETVEDKILPPQISEQLVFREDTSIRVELSERFIDQIIEVSGVSISGDITELGYIFEEGVDYELDVISSPSRQYFLRWIPGGNHPINNTLYNIIYSPTSVEVKIQSRSSGSAGNVAIGSISEMMDAVAGIEGVRNNSSTIGGTETETDNELRTRVPLYLSSLARATINAIRATALGVPGVVNISVSEPIFPTGVVRVFVDGGSGGASLDLLQRVRDAIDGTIDGTESSDAEGTRAAGIAVNVEAPVIEIINIEVQVSFDATLGIPASFITSEIENSIISYCNTITTGGTLLRSRLIDVIMDVRGVLDIDVNQLKINNNTIGNYTVRIDQIPRATVNSVRILEKVSI